MKEGCFRNSPFVDLGSYFSVGKLKFLCTCELYFVSFRFLYIFTMYLWVGEEGGEGGLEKEGGIECILYGYT